MPQLFLWLISALAVVLAPVLAAAAASAGASTPALCLDAARTAATRHGIPEGMMHAITLVETRRKAGGVTGPWPWTLNIDGIGYWYETKAEALAHAGREIAAGRISVDLGCFQINYRWHGGQFNALDEMLEPAVAADYAARFLGQLYAETGDWMRAAGLYHSRTPVHARRYRGLVGRAMASLDAAAAAPAHAPKPGPRTSTRTRALPTNEIALASARIGVDPTRAAAPGAVMLRMFASPARPLLATPGLKP